jgi:hypothetical protein
MFDLATDDVPGRYWRALKSFQRAPDGKPLSADFRIGHRTTDWLLEHGLLEVVTDNAQYRGMICYRLTPLGHQVFERGAHAR